MNEIGKFYKPENIRKFYNEIVPVYQTAFAGDPWFEVSKCADSASVQRCVGGLSSLSLGQLCELCGNCPIRTAYEQYQLINNFEGFAKTRPTAWYLERTELGITLAAIAWSAKPETIADEKYSDLPEVKPWLIRNLGTQPIIWLDEVFADRIKRPSGNLKNFGAMCIGLAEQLQVDTIAFRTINERMVTVAKRDFGNNASVFARDIAIPDRRDFVIINLGGTK